MAAPFGGFKQSGFGKDLGMLRDIRSMERVLGGGPACLKLANL